jgi:hypothetical protein
MPIQATHLREFVREFWWCVSGHNERCYIAKILEETKRRPHFIRKTIIRREEARSAADSPSDES